MGLWHCPTLILMHFLIHLFMPHPSNVHNVMTHSVVTCIILLLLIIIVLLLLLLLLGYLLPLLGGLLKHKPVFRHTPLLRNLPAW